MKKPETGKSSIFSTGPAPGGYAVLRDGGAATTPAGNPLVIPSRTLAEALAAEALNPAAPLMQLAATAIDITAKDRGKAISEIIAYVDSEHLCHRADYPAALAEEQRKLWQPVLYWVSKHYNAPLNTGTGIMPVAQPPASLAALRKAVEAYDAFRLTGLKQAVNSTGSFILGLALAEGNLGPQQAFEAAELDTSWQTQQWGEDPVIAGRRATVRQELELCARWFALLGAKRGRT